MDMATVISLLFNDPPICAGLHNDPLYQALNKKQSTPLSVLVNTKNMPFNSIVNKHFV